MKTTSLSLLMSGMFLLAACQNRMVTPVETTTPQMTDTLPMLATATAVVPETAEPVAWEIEVVAENLYVPWSIVFISTDHLLVSERSGAIREIIDGNLIAEPIYQFNDIAAEGEAGLMGLAVDPNFSSSGFLYACYTYQNANVLYNKVVRLKLDALGKLIFDRILLDDIPSASNHAGCRLLFAPDGKLFITTGDALQPESAQDIDSLAGKILRINSDGTIPADNPFPGSLIYSYGHRNPQGLSWDSDTGYLYETEHGPSGFDGPPGGDEINVIRAGANYGWPVVSHERTIEGTISPLIVFTPAEAPASAMIYSGKIFPQFAGNLFFGALRGEGVVRVIISGSESLNMSRVEKIIQNVGRVRDVVEGPDGYIYFTTSNRDGRGEAKEGDDKVYRLIPR